MPVYQVQISWTDGWHTECYKVEAETAEEACQAAVENAGDSDHFWTSCEPGPTIVDSIEKIGADGDAIPAEVLMAFVETENGPPPILSEAINLLSRVTREAGNSLSVLTLQAVRDLLLQAQTERGDVAGMT